MLDIYLTLSTVTTFYTGFYILKLLHHVLLMLHSLPELLYLSMSVQTREVGWVGEEGWSV